MSNPAVDVLKKVLGQYGPSVCQTPRMCEMLIRKDCHLPPAEMDALMAAVNSNVVSRLLTRPDTDRGELATHLCQQARLTPTTAKWAVECWAAALATTPRREGPQSWR